MGLNTGRDRSDTMEQEKGMELKTLPLREVGPILVPEGFRPFCECDDFDDELVLWLYQIKEA